MYFVTPLVGTTLAQSPNLEASFYSMLIGIILSASREGLDYIQFKQFVNGEREETQEEWESKWEKDILTYAVLRGTNDILGDRLEILANTNGTILIESPPRRPSGMILF
jgi:hypothetical protein